MRVGHDAPCLSDYRLYSLRQAARNQLYPCVGRGQACPPFPALSSQIDVEGVGFRPRAVVAGRGVVAVCTCISSQEYVYDK